MNSPLNWFGGKYYMRKDICSIIKSANCTCCVDAFGGSGIIALNCTNSVIVYNDINEGLYLFFKLLRKRESREKLIEAIQLTPYSRREFEDSLNWESESDDIEKARLFYVRTMQSVSTNGGWSYTKSKSRRGMAQAVSRWLGNVEENLPDVVEKLMTVQVENLDFLTCIEKYDSEVTVHYLDPPYVLDTRGMKKGYKHEMTDEQHIMLVNKLLDIKGKAVLSGYEHKIYEPLEGAGWRKVKLGAYAKHSEKVITVEHSKGDEFVWINFNDNGNKIKPKPSGTSQQLSFFDAAV